LYSISARLAEIFNIHGEAFGGKNMIFAGDFAQLPPVKGATLYSGEVSSINNHAMTPRQQESTIGKLLWQQVTTVVILKENMRQRSQTPEDAKLRAALENMRYGACTLEDISFLRTLKAGKTSNSIHINEEKYRHVSIITAWNAQKDRINEQGCLRFAQDTKQTLTDFYSIDTDNNHETTNSKKGRHSSKSKKKPHRPLTSHLRDTLWNSSPCTSDHIPGKLSLCLGMPIMIRHNDATELCITKGQEGFVAGWDSCTGPHGKEVLLTLFVKLDKPPKDIQIPGLPLNVVPIPRTSTTVQCLLPNDSIRSVHREQVVVLPNFAMTDYSSQGKTRDINIVDLGHCYTTQSYYTCLSRSANAANTVILQGFSSERITSGIGGYLRQEFRELEMLNDITKLKYMNELPEKISGLLCNPLQPIS
jgi:hypothetical protein